MLSSEFRHRDLVEKRGTIRNVATSGGARYYGAPIGTPITAAMKAKAKARHGGLSEAEWKAKGQPKPAAAPVGGRARVLADALHAAKTDAELDAVLAAAKKEFLKNKIKQADYNAIKGAVNERKANGVAAADKPGTEGRAARQAMTPNQAADRKAKRQVEAAAARGAAKKPAVQHIGADGKDKGKISQGEAQRVMQGGNAPKPTYDRIDSKKTPVDERKMQQEAAARAAAKRAEVKARGAAPKASSNAAERNLAQADAASAQRRRAADWYAMLERDGERAGAARLAQWRNMAQNDDGLGRNAKRALIARIDRLGAALDAKNKKPETGKATRAERQAGEAKGTGSMVAAANRVMSARGEMRPSRYARIRDDLNARYKAAKDAKQAANKNLTVDQYNAALKRVQDAKNLDELQVVLDSLQGGAVDRIAGRGVVRNVRLKRALNDAIRAKNRQLLSEKRKADEAAKGKAAANNGKDMSPERAKAVHAEYQKLLNDARNEADMNALMDKLEADKSLNDNQFNAVADAVDRVAEAKNYMNVKINGEPFGVDDGSGAVRKHLNDGGSVFDAPDGPIWEVIQSMPDRFEAKKFSKNGNISDSYKVVDKKTGQVFFVKDTGGGEDGAGKEHAAGLFGNAYGFFTHRVAPGQEVANGIPLKNVAIEGVIKDTDAHLYGFGEKFRGQEAEVGDRIRKGPEPESFMAMVMFDYLIANDEDRHYMNFHVMEDKKGGLRTVILDHGRAFGGMYGNQRKPAEYAPFASWFTNYRRRSARGWDATAVARAAYPNAREAEAALAKIIARMEDGLKKADPQSVVEGKGGYDKYAEQVRKRIEHLRDPQNRDAILRALL